MRCSASDLYSIIPPYNLQVPQLSVVESSGLKGKAATPPDAGTARDLDFLPTEFLVNLLLWSRKIPLLLF